MTYIIFDDIKNVDLTKNKEARTMGRNKATSKIINRVNELCALGVYKKDIPSYIEREFGVKISRRKIFYICKTLHIPETHEVETEKTTMNIMDLISLRLLYFCNDLELLTKMFAYNCCCQNTDTVIIPKKVLNIIPCEKIKKIIQISKIAGLNINAEYRQSVAF